MVAICRPALGVPLHFRCTLLPALYMYYCSRGSGRIPVRLFRELETDTLPLYGESESQPQLLGLVIFFFFLSTENQSYNEVLPLSVRHNDCEKQC